MSRISPRFHHPSRSRGAMAAFLLLFILFFASSSHARYVLEKGKGIEVCVAYEKALNGSNRVASPYSRPLDPNAKEFSKPKWEALHIREYEFLPKVWRYRFDRDVNPVNFYGVNLWRQWRGTKEQYAQAWDSYLVSREEQGSNEQFLARFDIDNDGQPDTVYLDHMNRALFVVLNNDQIDLDYDKTERAQGHPPRKTLGLGEFMPAKNGDWGIPPNEITIGITPVPDAFFLGATYDFFFYRDKTYYDLWWSRHPSYRGRPDWEVGRLQVFILEKGKRAREICTYRIQREDKE